MTEHTNTQHSHAPTPQRSLSLFGAGIIGVSLFGFLVGIVGGNRMQSPQPPDNGKTTAHGDVPDALSYRQIPNASVGPNADWTSDLERLRQQRPSRLDPVESTLEMKLAAIEDRSHTRAFDGAPPVIPHRIDQRTADSCLVCHGDGMKLGDRIATKMSHAHFTNCTQCHVETVSSGPFADASTNPVENSFTGLYRAGPGDRAYASAPPTIPHTTFLREDCMSCHGTITRPGLRTTHPWLTNCTQCHVASADLDLSVQWSAEFTNGSQVK